MMAEGNSRVSAMPNAWREAGPNQSKRIKDSWRDAFWKKKELDICLMWIYWTTLRSFIVFFSSSDREFVTDQKNKKEMLKGRQLLISGGKKSR